ncbi:MAG: S24 family peptidase, partial [Candidatus Acidiferrum sp.]
MPRPIASAHADSAHEARLNLAAEMLHRFGEVRFVAHGSSMIPSIYPGDLLTVRSGSPDTVRRGEIVLALLGGRFFVHRVMRKWPERDRVVFAT